jgi:hypothetical protein
MAYTIEVSIHLSKFSNISDIESNLYFIADKYNYDRIYKLEEIDGTSKIPRYHSIIAISFLKTQIDIILHFIKNIKKYKYYNIECIYEDNIKTKLIYATKYYLNIIDKDCKLDYIKFKKERCYSEEEIMLLNGIKVF